MVFKPEELARDAPPVVLPNVNIAPIGGQESSGCLENNTWRPLFRHGCTFNPDMFIDVMINQIKNPNINSSWLFRADILHDSRGQEDSSTTSPVAVESSGEVKLASVPSFVGLELRRSLIRRLIPRNTMRDNPLDQTCLIYQSIPSAVDVENNNANDQDSSSPSSSEEEKQTLVVYLPHVSSPEEMPFYHPVVRGIAFLHKWTPTSAQESQSESSSGSISVSYLFFDGQPEPPVKVIRTAMHLLEAIYKHGQGRVEGYQKRVHHDLLVPQARLQNTYMRLKQTYAKSLIVGWAETTDPGKHVFEDLCIAAFLIELWADMYGQGGNKEKQGGPPDDFPGFVDIGCGNGLLVYILNQEGYKGWGFDARARKSWASYNIPTECPDGRKRDSLRQFVLLPPPAAPIPTATDNDDGPLDYGSTISSEDAKIIHNGRFPKGTFIISNHADELTPWTPILATISDCPFIMIPCCSHDLTGAKFRAPPPKDKSKADSAYSSLVAWVSQIARDCGWEPEQEMLRIPSTRNTAVVGRKKIIPPGMMSCNEAGTASVPDIPAIVARYGGTAGYLETVIKLARTGKKDKEEH